MNDMHKCSKILSFILFADDTNAFYSDTNVKALNQTINNELIKVSKWLQVNKLTLNIKKTQVILFNAKNKKIKEPLKLKINGENIKQVNFTKFLGIIIDSKLTWKQHIAHIQQKISKTIGIICKTRLYVSLKVLRMLYYTLIYPYLSSLGKYISIKSRSIEKNTKENYKNNIICRLYRSYFPSL